MDSFRQRPCRPDGYAGAVPGATACRLPEGHVRGRELGRRGDGAAQGHYCREEAAADQLAAGPPDWGR